MSDVLKEPKDHSDHLPSRPNEVIPTMNSVQTPSTSCSLLPSLDSMPTAMLLQYEKMTEYHFLNITDWKLYAQFCEDKRQMKRLTKQNELYRLMTAFKRLYREYSFLCDTWVPRANLKKIKRSTDMSENGDSLSESARLFSASLRTNNGRPREGHSLTEEEDSRASPESQLDVLLEDGGFMKDARGGTYSVIPQKSARNLFGRLCKVGRRKRRSTCVGNPSRQPVLFDRLFRYRGNPLDVYEQVQPRTPSIHHRINYEVMDTTHGCLRPHWTHVPLALELLLPKIQAQIEVILTACPFLMDPLEVASELRFFNYDAVQCITYFNETRYLRTIIDEFLPRDNAPEFPQGVPIFPRSLFQETSLLLETQEPVEKCDKQTQIVLKKKMVRHIGVTVKLNDDASASQLALPSSETTPSARKDLQLVKGLLQQQRKQLADIRMFHQDMFNSIHLLTHFFFASTTELAVFFLYCLETISEQQQQQNLSILPAEDATKFQMLMRQLETLKRKLGEEEKKRRGVYNMMQEQLGNVRVYCRCRQLEDKESILKITGNDSLVMMVPPCEEFKFDKVFPSGTSQKDIYEEFRPLVLSFMDGYNVCFITYGGEASGKTFTLIGNEERRESHGLVHRSLETVLNHIKSHQRDWTFKVDATCVEIYNDTFYDFFAEESNIQLYVDSGLEAMHERLQTVSITSKEDIDALVRVCRLKRRMAKTALNPGSSRSHLIIMLRLSGHSNIHGQNVCSFLGLCDLAGFEDVMKAETYSDEKLSKEAGYINRSLTAFNRMFVLLQEKDPSMVSYRDSKLTHVLKGFLTNSGKCTLIVTVRDDKLSMGSTQNTLRFGRETRTVKLGRARKQLFQSE